jgi:hypothetical protein
MTDIAEVQLSIDEAGREAARATGEFSGAHDGEYAVALSNLAVAKSLLLIHQDLDDTVDLLRSIISSGYLDVRTVQG